MVSGILVLLIMGMFILPKILCPAAPSNTVWVLGLVSLILLVAAWFLYGQWESLKSRHHWWFFILIQSHEIYFLLFSPPPSGSYLVYSVYPPNYNKNLNDTNRGNNIIYSPAGLDNRPGQNQNIWMISNNQSLLKMIKTLVLSNISSQTSGERLDAPHAVATLPYCDRTVYLFAFWTTTLAHVGIGVSLFVFLGLYVFTKLLFLAVERNWLTKKWLSSATLNNSLTFCDFYTHPAKLWTCFSSLTQLSKRFRF